MMFSTLLEVFRSPRRADCDERVFMLTAVGVPSRLDFDGFEFVLRVDEPHYEVARAHLARYALESRPGPPPPPPIRLNPFAWMGCVAYVFALFFVGYSVAGGYWRPRCVRSRRDRCSACSGRRVVACVDCADLARRCGPSRCESRRGGLVWLPRRTTARPRPHMAAHGDRRGHCESARGAARACGTSLRWCFDGCVHCARLARCLFVADSI